MMRSRPSEEYLDRLARERGAVNLVKCLTHPAQACAECGGAAALILDTIPYCVKHYPVRAA